MSIIEWQVLASTLFVLPVTVAVVVALMRGSFRNAERTKHVVIERREIDYWESCGRDSDRGTIG